MEFIPGLITFVIQPSANKIWMEQTSFNSLTGSLARSLTHSFCMCTLGTGHSWNDWQDTIH